MKVDILSGHQADELIHDPEFRVQWNRLQAACPWASVYQGPDFVSTWYDAYKTRITPIIVRGRNSAGELAGLFTLGLESGKLIAAGASHAEYHAWLALPQEGDEFIESAIEILQKNYPAHHLTLLFAPPAIPLDWTQPGARWSEHCYVKPMPRGLLTIGDGIAVKDSLRKKQNKINRLKRLGNLHLDRIPDHQELEQIFDEVISLQTFRLRAIQNLHNLADDPFKKTFYSRLMQIPGMVHATALRLDDRLVSAQIHIHNSDQVVLTLITHSPVYAKHSPGMLHTFMVAVEFAKEGVSVFDLTPGGDYKDRYASHHDGAYVVTIFFNRAHCRRFQLQRKLADESKSFLQKFKISSEQLNDRAAVFSDHARKWAALRKELGLAGAASELIGLLGSRGRTSEACVYSFNLKRAGELPARQSVKQDHIPDLLAYRPQNAMQPPVNGFLKQAWDLFEAGNHSYTQAEDGCLHFYGWLMAAPIPEPVPDSVPGDAWNFVLPEGGVLLAGIHASSRAYDQGICEAAIAQMLRDAAQIPNTEMAYLILPAEPQGDSALRRTIEGLGFTRHSTPRKA